MQPGRIAVFAEKMRESSHRMNLEIVSLLFAGLFIVSGCIPASYEGGGQEPVNDVQYLESYGEWFEMPPYGFVWHPFVVRDWAPFSHGHWMWTNDGWAWVSYEPFGWLVYHYGFWDYRREIGWFWIPGDEWSPARVEWYTSDDYCAWAPLPPPTSSGPRPGILSIPTFGSSSRSTASPMKTSAGARYRSSFRASSPGESASAANSRPKSGSSGSARTGSWPRLRSARNPSTSPAILPWFNPRRPLRGIRASSAWFSPGTTSARSKNTPPRSDARCSLREKPPRLRNRDLPRENRTAFERRARIDAERRRRIRFFGRINPRFYT